MTDTIFLSQKCGSEIIENRVHMTVEDFQYFREEVEAELRDRIAQELEALGYDSAASVVRATAPIEPEEVYSPHTIVKDM